jgi:probable HAF family extracellular repeat protein
MATPAQCHTELRFAAIRGSEIGRREIIEQWRRRVTGLRQALLAALLTMLSANASFAQCTPVTPCASPPTDLGSLGNKGAIARGTNSDGSVVVGLSHPHAFRWTVIDGMQDLGTLGGIEALALDVSGDGSVVVGNSSLKTSGSDNIPQHAFRWTLTMQSLQDLGTLGTGDISSGNAVSADGLVVVGESSTMPQPGFSLRAFRWTTGGSSLQDIGDLGGGFSSATATNSDGSVVVGASLVSGMTHAFRWTAANGMQDLGTLPGGSNSNASGTNSDGSVVVGQGDAGSGTVHAFRWTQADGMQDLGTLGGAISAASGTNSDGSVVVGCSSLNNTTKFIDMYSIATGGCTAIKEDDEVSSRLHAFRWTAETGLRDLNTLLSDAGVSTGRGGISFVVAHGVSGDGQWIVGYRKGPFQYVTHEAIAFRVCVATTGPTACGVWRWPWRWLQLWYWSWPWSWPWSWSWPFLSEGSK